MTHQPLGRIPKNRKNKKMDLQEFELQTRFINENMDILQKYLIWKEFVSEEPQFLNPEVQIEAVDVEATMLDKLMNLPGLNQTTDQE